MPHRNGTVEKSNLCALLERNEGSEAQVPVPNTGPQQSKFMKFIQRNTLPVLVCHKDDKKEENCSLFKGSKKKNLFFQCLKFR